MKSHFFSFTKIFDADITPKSKLVYIYLCRMANRRAACFPSRKTIATACSLCVQSVKRAVKELADAGLITKVEQHKENGRQTSNLYTIVKEAGDQYFYCDNDIFNHDISTNAKLVFIYLQRCADNGVSFPSYQQIAARCGLCVATVQSCIGELERRGLIQKRAQYRQNGGRANNLYAKPQPVKVSVPLVRNIPLVAPPRTNDRRKGYLFSCDVSTPPPAIYVPP